MEPRRPLLSAALHADTCVESARLGFRAGAFAIPFGRMNQLEVHHIFPKALLYRATEYGYTRPEVNAIANLTFLTKDTNLAVSDRDPAIYLEEIASQQPQ